MTTGIAVPVLFYGRDEILMRHVDASCKKTKAFPDQSLSEPRIREGYVEIRNSFVATKISNLTPRNTRCSRRCAEYAKIHRQSHSCYVPLTSRERFGSPRFDVWVPSRFLTAFATPHRYPKSEVLHTL